MKQIPFKCRFGHITIMKFFNKEEKPSQIECNECNNVSTKKVMVSDGGSRPWLAKFINWPTTKRSTSRIEMAVRF